MLFVRGRGYYVNTLYFILLERIDGVGVSIKTCDLAKGVVKLQGSWYFYNHRELDGCQNKLPGSFNAFLIKSYEDAQTIMWIPIAFLSASQSTIQRFIECKVGRSQT
jgi:hypothetical protein